MQNTDMYPRRRKPNEGFATVERYRELRMSGRNIKVKNGGITLAYCTKVE